MRFLPSVLVVMALLFGSETTIAEHPVDTPENRAARISALVRGNNPTWEERNEAVALAEQLIAVPEADKALIIPVCEAAAAAGDTGLLSRCVGRLEQVAPDEFGTDFWKRSLAKARGEVDVTTPNLDPARGSGLNELIRSHQQRVGVPVPG